MKIYLASSWKNKGIIINTRDILLREGHEVDAFCDTRCNRYIFNFNELGDISNLTNIQIHNGYCVKVDRAFVEDKKWLDWCDICIMIFPCGKSAHLEAGYSKGKNKSLIIFYPNDCIKGDLDVMYGFADLITSSYIELINFINRLSKDRLTTTRTNK